MDISEIKNSLDGFNSGVDMTVKEPMNLKLYQ